MIQRIQSLYLILIAVFSSGLMFVFPLWKDNQGVFYAYQAFKSNQIVLMSMAIAFLLVSFLAILSLFTYKKRKNQFVSNKNGSLPKKI